MGAAAARQKVAELMEATVAAAGIIGGSLNYLAPLARYVCERRS